MNDQTDSQLLRAYAELHSEPAFAELVRRHVDFVYSAARRMVRDSHLAEDVTQGVFLALARNAARLGNRPVLSGWLHRTAQNIAAQTVRTDVRRRAREQESAAMNDMLSAESDALWNHIAPHLDTALGELADADRDAVLLRYFERKSATEMGKILGISDEAAQKRVSRAVERLRDYLTKRGVTVGASGLVVVLSANAVQAAPVGLAVTISAAATLAGTVVSTSTAIAATKVIAMTALQKTIVATTAAVLAGAAIYEARHASNLRSEVQTLEQQNIQRADAIQQLTRERDEVARKLTALRDENEQLNRNSSELLRLRAEVGRLRNNIGDGAPAGSAEKTRDPGDPNWQPNWLVLSPFDLSRYPDSTTNIMRLTARDAGTATPAALLQTWIWAQRTGDADGLLKTWQFPEGTSEAVKRQRIAEVQRAIQDDDPERVGHFERSRLRDMLSLGNDRYLALIEEESPNTGSWVSHQMFRRMGDEWRVEAQ